MFDFCPHCGQTINQRQVEGRMLVCGECGQQIGFVGTVQHAAVDETEELIRGGTVACCPVCQQAVALKTAGSVKTLVPHYAAQTRKICAGSGKPSSPPTPLPVGEGKKDLSAYMTRDVIKMISCTRKGDVRIEVLALEYLDKTERVRIQIDALREMMGLDFRMNEYPPSLHKPHLGVWASADFCVIAKRHERGGFQPIDDAEIAAVLADVRQHQCLFFA